MTEAKARRIADERAMALLYPPAIKHDWTPPYRIKADEMRVGIIRSVRLHIERMTLLAGKAYTLDDPIFANGDSGKEIITRSHNHTADYEAHARDIIDRRPN